MLGEKLPQQPGAASAERDTDGDFFAAALRTGKNEVRDVRASNEKHETDGCEHGEHAGANVTDHLGVERLDRRRGKPLVRVRIFLCEPSGDRRHLGASALDRNTRLQSRNDAQPTDESATRNPVSGINDKGAQISVAAFGYSKGMSRPLLNLVG